MSCAACSNRVERAVSGLYGVSGCSVNLLTGNMSVEGDIGAQEVIDAVIAAGYGAQLCDAKTQNPKAAPIKENSNKSVIYRLIFSAILLIVLMYFSMGHTMWNFPVPQYFEGNYMAMGLLQLLLTTAVMIINQKFFISGFKGLINRAPNMDTLVALGSAAAYGYSCCNLFEMATATAEKSMHLLHNLYFESAAMILTLITVGKLLEGYAKGKTTNAIKSLIELAPKTARVVRNGVEVSVNAEDVLKDDIFVVLPGESFAVDGIVLEGSSVVDESSLTGESVPIDKNVGSKVSSATINKTGKLLCRATAVGEDSTLARIIKMVSDAASSKAPIARIADRVSAMFVPIVLGVALITLVSWLLLGQTVAFSLLRAISVLVISCPCALGLATPVAIMVGSGVGARRGILFKTAAALEMCGKCNVAVLDKTGTVTSGKPAVTDILPTFDNGENLLLQTAYTLESGSSHPLARAINDYAKEKGIAALNISDFRETAGFGVEGVINGENCFACSVLSAKEKGISTDSIYEISNRLSDEGKTPILFVKNGVLIGIIAVADTIKEDSESAVRLFKKLGVRVVMLTGDNAKTANAVAKAVGIDEIRAQVKPDEKALVVEELKQQGRVMMIGDGINDAPALTAADIGIAIGNGMDIAVESADVVLMNSNLTDAVDALKLSKKVLTNIKQNLFWAFVYNTIGIPLAAGVFIFALGWELNPMFAAAAMSLSSFCVVINALRLNFFKSKNKCERKNDKMEKIIKIEGMMCAHCEAHVKNALEALEGVTVTEVNHKKGIATVKILESVTDDMLKSTVKSQGYEVLNIE